jgi:hypothetical protein
MIENPGCIRMMVGLFIYSRLSAQCGEGEFGESLKPQATNLTEKNDESIAIEF